MLEAEKMGVMGRGNKGQLATRGLGPSKVRTCLWGDVWTRRWVAWRRTWMSLSLAPYPCAPGRSQRLPCLEVTLRGVGDPPRCG